MLIANPPVALSAPVVVLVACVFEVVLRTPDPVIVVADTIDTDKVFVLGLNVRPVASLYNRLGEPAAVPLLTSPI